MNPRHLILGTAGHIDHGKTALVRALTGTDTDRLPEEKARGITIDIGFARLDLGGVVLGVVDVPGHERFVRNMLAGASGADVALLAVAADDGVMPQTREHLEILKRLNAAAGVIALTKADTVSAEVLATRADEVRELVSGTFLESAPVIPTVAPTGAGIPELRAALAAACAAVPERADAGWFHLAIDRAFTVEGVGTVVTGTVLSGSVVMGDEVELLPDGGRVRVRGVQTHDAAAASVSRGQRAALNLAGVGVADVARGRELATPGALAAARVLTARVWAAPDARRPLRNRLPVRVHLGTLETPATLALLDAEELAPGASALAQLFLDRPVAAFWGRPLVLRDSSAEHTLGGGRVAQPAGRKLRRGDADALSRVARLADGAPDERAAEAARFAGSAGLRPGDLPRLAGLSLAQSKVWFAEQVAGGSLVAVAGDRAVSAGWAGDAEAVLLELLGRMHAQTPLAGDFPVPQLLARASYIADEPTSRVLLGRLLARNAVTGDARRVARADVRPRLSANQRKLKDEIVAAYAAAGLRPPDAKEFTARAAGLAPGLPDIFAVAVAEGQLVALGPGMFLSPAAEAEVRTTVAAAVASGPKTVAEIRDALGVTRKHAVPFCEYLDRVGVTARSGDARGPGRAS